MIKLNEKMVELESRNDEVVLVLSDYNSGNIGDIIMEISDSYVEIYNDDLWKWARKNSNMVEDAIDEFGFDSRKQDLISVFQMAQYLDNSNKIYDNFEDFKMYFLITYLRNEKGIKEISKSDYEILKEDIKNIDNNDYLDSLIDIISQ